MFSRLDQRHCHLIGGRAGILHHMRTSIVAGLPHLMISRLKGTRWACLNFGCALSESSREGTRAAVAFAKLRQHPPKTLIFFVESSRASFSPSIGIRYKPLETVGHIVGLAAGRQGTAKGFGKCR
jgi:hypothetical protein